MQSERWRTCTDIFHAALERAPDEREAFVKESCAGDDTLRRQVETLLKYHDDAGDFIASPAFAAAPELVGDDPDALIGRTLGNYRIDGVLGAGGMGVVYLAHDERLGRKVGLKLLPSAFVNDEAQLERLKLEARTASALNHPNIVTVHEIGHVDSTHYIAIEFIEGVTLRERITRGALVPDEATEIAAQVANALCVAHHAGIVHRDIKPENIMIRPDGYVKVLDFGIAKATPVDGTATAASQLSQTGNRTGAGVVMGTMRYMSPEQARGGTVDARSDIWSLGVVLYEMLTAHAPFDGKTVAEIKGAVLERDAAEIKEGAMPPPLQSIVEKCLRKDPAERFETSEELLVALRASSGRAGRKGVRYWRIAIAAAVLMMAGGIYVADRLVRPAAIVPPREASGSPALRSSTGLAVGRDDVVYVADFSHHTIRRITADGTMSDLAGVAGSIGSADGTGSDARFNHPGDAALDREGNIYVADTNNHSIRKVTPQGAVSTIAGEAGESGTADGIGRSARFNFPTAVALDGAGNLYVADFANHIIRKITPDGRVRTIAGSAGEAGSADGAVNVARFDRPHGLGVDSTGHIYVADFGSHTIRKITPNGAVSTLAGLPNQPGTSDGAGAAARFNSPYDVAVDGADNVYVADTSNHLIRKITPAGKVSTLAGAAGSVGSVDGSGNIARFAIPAAVAVDAAGEVYVADFGNHAIRTITPAGDVSTLPVRWVEARSIETKSIAVLPFTDLSPQRDQQYFSDGMSEEILNALAHVKELRVVGRSSSFAFRGRNEDVRHIGATLGVAHILEGSVRRQGDRVRITTQLIQASDGFQLWSESYDGQIDDVFSLQERIARAITDQLKVVLQGEQKSRLVRTATTSTEAYALYLQANAIFNRRDSARFADAVAQLKEAIRLDPKFARARARLASLASITRSYDVHLAEDVGEMVEREARLAIQLDPALAEPHAALGQMLFTKRRFSEAHAAYRRALMTEPEDATANFWLATLLSSAGQPKASAVVLDKLLVKDPMLPSALLWRGWVHLQLGATDEAERSIRRAADAGLTAVGLAFAHVSRARGDRDAQRDWLARGLEPFMRDLSEEGPRVIAAATVASREERHQAMALIENYLATQPAILSGAVPLALMWVDEPERALALAQEKPTRNDTVFLPSLWTTTGQDARRVPQFGEFARRTGLAEFWDKAGPPDLCRKNANGDYVCQ